ncbi:endonuclease domain-containing protein [Streptomyces sp. NBC_01800]|uniref:endonuclease domain-containing protein n=1 Tax=Streptomyces sp. NBC_01800 TaxID=2975945 RepID=UPI003FA38907
MCERRPYSEQDGHCATCPGPAEVVDHSHRSGIVRGVLLLRSHHRRPAAEGDPEPACSVGEC